MKKIRLEFPVRWGEDSIVLLPSKIWLKVVDDCTEAFRDKKLMQSFSQTGEKISVEVDVPEDLEVIEINPPTPLNPVDSIFIEWCQEARMAGLEKVYVIFNDNKTHEVKVIDERPDAGAWKEYTETDDNGMFLFTKTWALVVYVMDSKCTGKFYFKDKTRCRRRELTVL